MRCDAMRCDVASIIIIVVIVRDDDDDDDDDSDDDDGSDARAGVFCVRVYRRCVRVWRCKRLRKV